MKKILTILAVGAMLFSCRIGEEKTGGPSLRLFTEPGIDLIEFSASADESYDFVVKSSLNEWYATCEADWVLIRYVDGGFVVTVDPQPIAESRDADILLFNAGAIADGSTAPDVTIKVVQFGGEPELIVTPTTDCEFSALSGTEKQKYTYKVSTNVPSGYTVETDEDWCIATKTTTGFTVTALDNAWAAEGTATVTVKADGCDDVVINVTQVAADPFLEILPQTNTVTFAWQGTETYNYTVFTNVPSGFTLSNGGSTWCTVANNGTTAEGDPIITISATENDNPTARPDATITISATGCTDITITAKQKAHIPAMYKLTFGTGGSAVVKEYPIDHAELFPMPDGIRTQLVIYPYENPFMPFQCAFIIRNDKLNTTMNTASGTWGGGSTTENTTCITITNGASNTFQVDGSYDTRTGSLRIDKDGTNYTVDLTIANVNNLKIEIHWDGVPVTVGYDNEIPMIPVNGTLAYAQAGALPSVGGMVYSYQYGSNAAGTTTYMMPFYYENFDDDGADSYNNAYILKWPLFYTATSGYAPRAYTYSNSATSNGNFGYQSSSRTQYARHNKPAALVNTYLRTSGTNMNTLTAWGVTFATGAFSGTLKATANTNTAETAIGTITCDPAWISTLYPVPAYAPGKFAQHFGGKNAQDVRREMARMRAASGFKPTKIRE